MVQEARIGLVVGLMFIIAFGLILAELTGERETGAPAVGAQVGQDSLLWPGPVVAAPVGGGAEPIEIAAVGPVEQVVQLDEPEAAGRDATTVGPTSNDAGAPPESLMPPVEAAIRRPSADPPEPAERYYLVRPNDTLIRIARKVYGRGREQQYRRIFDANADQLEDESAVYVGQKLLIPPLEGPSYREMDMAQLREHFASGAPVKSAGALRRRIYVVQEADTLTSIAKRTLNDSSASAVRRIYQANLDKLDSPDELVVGMKLRIPM